MSSSFKKKEKRHFFSSTYPQNQTFWVIAKSKGHTVLQGLDFSDEFVCDCGGSGAGQPF